MNSSKETCSFLLASPLELRRADSFLCELANIPDRAPDRMKLPESYLAAWSRVIARYRDLFPKHGYPADERPTNSPDAPGMAWFSDDPKELLVEDIPIKLKRAWVKPTAIGRQIYLLLEIAWYLRAVAAETEWRVTQDTIDPFAFVLLRALHVADRMRFCPNPGCPAPYFIAARRSQKYCSEACALPAQREFKRAWWAEHGTQWRVKRESAARKWKKSRKVHERIRRAR